MQVVGEKFRCNEVYVPEVLVAARAMKKSLAILKPLLIQTRNQAGWREQWRGPSRATCTTLARIWSA